MLTQIGGTNMVVVYWVCAAACVVLFAVGDRLNVELVKYVSAGGGAFFIVMISRSWRMTRKKRREEKRRAETNKRK